MGSSPERSAINERKRCRVLRSEALMCSALACCDALDVTPDKVVGAMEVAGIARLPASPRGATGRARAFSRVLSAAEVGFV